MLGEGLVLGGPRARGRWAWLLRVEGRWKALGLRERVRQRLMRWRELELLLLLVLLWTVPVEASLRGGRESGG